MILVAIPYHEQKRYALNHIMDWVRDAELPDTEVIMRFHRGVYGEKDAVKNQREFFRNLAIEKGASHLLFVGCDTIPPLNVLSQLLAHNVDVAGGIYYGRHGAENGDPQGAVAWKHSSKDFNQKENLSQLQGLELVDGMGMDCVLFSREAFTKVSFLSWEQNDDDYPYYDKLKEAGFKIYLDAAVICKHYATESIAA